MIKILSYEDASILRESSTIKIKTLEEQLGELGFKDFRGDLFKELTPYLDLKYDLHFKQYHFYANNLYITDINLKTIQDVKTFIEYFKYYPESK